MTDPLAGALAAAGSGWARIRYGVVVTTSPLTVRIDGSVVAVSGRISPYTAVVGHTVVILADSSNMIVLGRFVNP
jgi:hypothetical protein